MQLQEESAHLHASALKVQVLEASSKDADAFAAKVHTFAASFAIEILWLNATAMKAFFGIGFVSYGGAGT